ncbi:MAG: hypothetical protein WC648_04675 [Candidatus Paceibacterota bacterium]|jgi:hypothetical protein
MLVTHIEEKPLDMMQSMVHDQFNAMFDSIEHVTVYTEKLSDITTRYTCDQVDLLVKYVSNKIENAPEGTHPTISDKGVYKFGGKYAIDLSMHRLEQI